MITLDLRSFAYDDGAGLADISLAVGAGERVLVAGASGAGKSTLAKVLAGQFDAGQGHRFVGSLALAGEELHFHGNGTDPRIDPAAWAALVGYVGQRADAQLSMVSATVAEEIAFGPSNRGVPADRLHDLVSRTADRVGLTDLLQRDPRRLSGGQLQRVCIAAAVVDEPGLLVLDEPFKGLDAAGREDVEELIAGLRGAGTAVVQFEPMLPANTDAVDRVVILAGGTVVAHGGAAPDGGAPATDVRAYGIGVTGADPGAGAGAGAGADPGADPVEPSGSRPGALGEPVLEIQDLTFAYGAEAVLSGAELTVRTGEAVAVLGPNGSGKSTLLQQVNGLLRPDAGSVRLQGRNISGRPTGSLAATVGYLFQDSDQQLFERTVLREASYGPRAAGRSAREAERAALTALAAVGLEQSVLAHPHDLAFRQRRLLAIASMMATGPVLWVLDEPTVGLDLLGRDVLARVIRSHVCDGGAVLMATHDEAFAASVCTRALSLDQGRVAGIPLR